MSQCGVEGREVSSGPTEGPHASYPGTPGGGVSAGILRSKIRRAPKAASAARKRDRDRNKVET